MPHEYAGGIERVSFSVGQFAFKKAVQRSEGDPAKLKRALLGHYCYDPKPSFREVLQVSVNTQGSLAEITMTIARGHYAISEILRRHGGTVTIEPGGRLTCTCHPGAVCWLPLGATVSWPEFYVEPL